MSDNAAVSRTPAYFGLADCWADTAPGERTHFHRLGVGVPMTFVHGSGAGVSAAANWWLNLGPLSSVADCIAPDLVGFGLTERPDDGTLGIRAWGEHLLRLLDVLGVERTWLVGNSLGGWISLQLALDHPERVLGVVSMGTGGSPRRSSALASHSAPVLTLDAIRATLEDFVEDKTLVSDELVEARYCAAITDQAQHNFAASIQAREHDRAEFPLDEERLRNLQLPVLLVHGREDSVIPPERSWRLAQLLPDCEFHLYSHCGHWSQVERASEFNALVHRYLVQHSTGPSGSVDPR